MRIEFQQVSKRFAYEWIFRNMDLNFQSGDSWGIVGPNGSGKSTFIRLLMGTLDPSVGSIQYRDIDGKSIHVNQVFNHFSFTAPYMDIPPNYTMDEIIKFHFSFRSPIEGLSPKSIISLSNLDKSKRKAIRQFSSGMKQRVKLALALCTDSDYVVLDEPTTNLDDSTKEWFHDLVKNQIQNRGLIIATNEKDDLLLCEKQVKIIDYK